MRRMLYLAVVLVAALLSQGESCRPKPPGPTPTPEPTIPAPVCEEGQTCGCWHQPPGEPWQQLPPCPTPTPPPDLTCANVDCAPGFCCRDTASGPKCEPCPTPPPSGCVLAGEPSIAVPGQANTLGDRVNLAMKALRPNCEIGGTCLLGDVTQQEWQAQVNAKLREAGLCAGQHTPTTDEIAVAPKPTDNWQGFHVFAGDDSNGPVPPGKPRRTVRWSPQAYTGAWLPPSTPPPAEGCKAPLPDRDPSKLRIQIHVGGGWADGTIQTVGTLTYCEQIGMSPMADGTPRASCPMRSECPGFQCELRSECETYASRGGPVWQTQPAGLEVEHRQGNPWVARSAGASQIRVCTSDLGVCSAWVAAP